MPPKKRSRDTDPDAGPPGADLDAEEVKGMLRDSIDREAKLEAEKAALAEDLLEKTSEKEKLGKTVEEVYAKLEAAEEKVKAEREAAQELEIKYHEFAEEVYAKLEAAEEKAGATRWAAQRLELNLFEVLMVACKFVTAKTTPSNRLQRYHNFNVVARAKGFGLLNKLTVDLSNYWPTNVSNDLCLYYVGVDTCTKLVNIFEGGLKAGDVLQTEPSTDTLHSVTVYTDKKMPLKVTAGQERQYLPLCATSASEQLNLLMVDHLVRTQEGFQEFAPKMTLLLREGREYDDEVQRLVKDADFNAVFHDVLVKRGTCDCGAHIFHKVRIDLDRMVEVADGSQVETPIGFA